MLVREAEYKAGEIERGWFMEALNLRLYPLYNGEAMKVLSRILKWSDFVLDAISSEKRGC